MKHYQYNPSHYMIQMTIPGIFCVFIGLYSLYQFLVGGLNPIWLLVFGVCFYNVWNLVVSISNPSDIYIDDEKLVFSAYSRQHEYRLDEIQKYAMRPLAGGERMYMIINNSGLMKGRYWVRLGEFNDEKELTQFFYKLDAQVNPDSVFTTARQQGLERQKNKGKKK